MVAEFAKEAAIVVKETQRRFEELTEDWSEKVDWSSDSRIEGNNIIMETTTHSQIFHFVDQGTEPHIIPKGGRENGSLMSFQPDYSPRTRPDSFSTNSGGGVSSGPTVFAREVQHPGIEARNFSGLEARFTRRRLASRLFRALRRVRT